MKKIKVLFAIIFILLFASWGKLREVNITDTEIRKVKLILKMVKEMVLEKYTILMGIQKVKFQLKMINQKDSLRDIMRMET